MIKTYIFNNTLNCNLTVDEKHLYKDGTSTVYCNPGQADSRCDEFIDILVKIKNENPILLKKVPYALDTNIEAILYNISIEVYDRILDVISLHSVNHNEKFDTSTTDVIKNTYRYSI